MENLVAKFHFHSAWRPKWSQLGELLEGIYFAVTMKNIMSMTYRFPQTTYGNSCGSYSRKIISNLVKDVSYKLSALLWELRWQSLFLPSLWQTLKSDYFRLALLNHWKRFIDYIFPLWMISMKEVADFVNFTNSFHPSIKFTCEMSSERVVFLDTKVFEVPITPKTFSRQIKSLHHTE